MKKIAVLLAALFASAALFAAPKTSVTFTKDVAPILYQNCATCHRPGEVAPMSLLTYKEVRPWVKSIREKVASRAMPPWQADARFGHFLNDRTLAQKDIDTIVAWVDGGAVEGDAKALAPAPQFKDEWALGKPDMIISMSEEYKVPAEGTVEYQHFLVPTNFTEDRFVQAAEIRPANRALVHHVIVFVQPPPSSQMRPFGIRMGAESQPPHPEPDAIIDGRKFPRGRLGLFMAATAPGDRGMVFPAGSAFRVPAGSNFIFQVHYTPNGKGGIDRSRVGLHFAKQSPEFEVKTIGVQNGRFVIPAGESNYKVTSWIAYNEDARLWGFAPHMHLRGKSFEYRLVYPDGRSEVILSVPKYDFAWQTFYSLKEPLVVPKGSRIECTAYFDNSSANHYNPDPSKQVEWGDQTWEEMMIGFTTYSLDSQRLTK